MERIIYFVTIFVLVAVVLASSMGVNPHFGYYDLQNASNHIASASPTGDASGLGMYAYYMEATVTAWETWQRYSGGNGDYAVRVVIPEEASHYENGIPVYRSAVERKRTDIPIASWDTITYTNIRMPSGIDNQSVRRIFDAMGSGLFGLASGSPSAVASNIAITMAEEMAVSQFSVWWATFESLLYVVGLSNSLE